MAEKHLLHQIKSLQSRSGMMQKTQAGKVVIFRKWTHNISFWHSCFIALAI